MRQEPPRANPASHEAAPDLVYGRHPVTEALQNGRVRKLLIDAGRSRALGELMQAARQRGVPVDLVDLEHLNRLSAHGHHQGVVAYATQVPLWSLQDLLERAKANPQGGLLVALDQVADPQNVGSLFRSADGAGVDGILLLERRAAGLTAAVGRASSGAIEYVPASQIGNLAKTLDVLKEEGFWIAAADPDGDIEYTRANLTGPLVLVIGAEGQGVRPLVLKKADLKLRIPLLGRISSLNAAVAGAIIMYEVARQRRVQQRRDEQPS